MGYDENDAAEEAFYEQMYARFRHEHADEIADEITTGEPISEVVHAHKEWWPLVHISLRKAHERLEQGEYAEALFHLGRGFDGYMQNVLVTPLRVSFVLRLQRFMPDSFPIREVGIFKSVTGLGSAIAFANYTISLLAATPAEAEAVIRRLRQFMGQPGDGPSWQDRNIAFHAPIGVSRETAEALLEQAEAILNPIIADVQRLSAQEQNKIDQHQFSLARIEMLHALAQLFDEDREAALPDSEIPWRPDAIERRYEALDHFVALGYVEHIDGREHGFPFPRREYRLTDQGRNYYEREIVKRLPKA